MKQDVQFSIPHSQNQPPIEEVYSRIGEGRLDVVFTNNVFPNLNISWGQEDSAEFRHLVAKFQEGSPQLAQITFYNGKPFGWSMADDMRSKGAELNAKVSFIDGLNL